MKKIIKSKILVPTKSIEMRRALERLNPQEKGDRLYIDYQRKKKKLMIGLIIIGLVSALGVHLSSRMETRLAEGAQLIRNEWGAGDYKIKLVAQTEDWSKEIPFLVEERLYTEEEKEQLKARLLLLLPQMIKGKNQDLQHVTENLNLMNKVQGYPFILSWSSDNRSRIEMDGSVNRKGIASEGEWVTLQVIIKDTQQKTSDTAKYKVYILQEVLDEEEAFFRILSKRLSEESEDKAEESQILLPQEINGIAVNWKEKKENNSIFVLLLFLLGSVLAGKGMDRDLQRSFQKRNRQLMEDYAGFVNKLRLYLSAGLTVRNAFIRITTEYGCCSKKEKKHYLYEELKISCFQLENGIAEEQIYLDFGKRCGEIRFRRLSSLLGVNLKQGNNQLLLLLAKEADSAQEDHRNLVKKISEEAGTKLLLPMMLMLMIVMFLILLPAYLNFERI